MSKRLPETDIPRRIYKTTVDRINGILDKRDKGITKKYKKVGKKRYDFNLFLIELLNVYEELQKAPIFYVNDFYEDPAEARGVAVQRAVRNKQPIVKPTMMVVIGEDDDA